MTKPARCPSCHGHGKVHRMLTGAVRWVDLDCWVCAGSGWIVLTFKE